LLLHCTACVDNAGNNGNEKTEIAATDLGGSRQAMDALAFALDQGHKLRRII
jgi:hypothetical protein